jgi:PhzF family phenazine biosynthesis protein
MKERINMPQTIYQVDAFTNKPFSGNPAAVCLLEKPADENWMQQVALEMNLSETSFLYQEKDGYNLRWFTPTVEVNLCGHATLATAHILWEQKIIPTSQTAVFYTKSGKLTAVIRDKLIELNFPTTKPTEQELPEKLLKALGTDALFVGKNRFDYLIEVASADIVRNIIPNFSLLKDLQIRGVIVTAQSDIEQYDIISRFFAPGAGIDEDPVTGSAHCTLSPYWSEKLHKNELKAYQASKRGGELTVIHQDNRVLLRGEAVTVMKIELL